MPVELIGEVGTAGASRKRIRVEAARAIRHLKKTCGAPPPEMKLTIRWAEHELGPYPIIALEWEDATRGAPWGYIAKCQEALDRWNQ